MTDLKKWHVLKDMQTNRRSCCYYDKDEPTFDFGEPDPLEGKEEIPFDEWTSKEIAQILSSFLDYAGFGELAFLPETVIQALDRKVDESKKVEIMRAIMDGVISKDLD